MQNSPARSGIDVGSVIADTYTIEALIGRGGMGAVFLASHKRLPGKQVAIKVLHAEVSGEEVLARFRREAEIASRLGHPNIVQVHDFNVMPDGTPYLVLEYLVGESLAQRLRSGPLQLEPALSIVRQVGSALAAAHREGIIHRDLKPQNIFIVPTEVDGRVVEIAKVLDFGISKIRGSQTVKTQDSALLGTPQYMAPEQATGQHSLVDERTDIFALGAIVYEMLSGRPAFSGETSPEVVFKVVYESSTPLAQLASLPASITAAVDRALAKKPDERFANVGELVEALTGRALAPLRPGASLPPPDLGFAAGSRAPNTDKEAFAQTMGSVDRPAHAGSSIGTERTISAGGATQVPAPSPPAPVQSTATWPPAGMQAPASAPSPTAQVPARSPSPATQTPATGSAAPPTATEPPRKKTGLVVAALVGAAALAGGIAFVATRESKPAPAVAQTGSPQRDPVHEADSPPPTMPESPAPAITDASAEAAAPTPPASAGQPDGTAPAAETEPAGPPVATRPGTASKPRPTKPTSAPAADDDETGGDEVAAGKLADAQQALAASQWDRAEALANAVSSSPDATRHQKARAALIYGTVQCLGRNDEGRARIALRKLAGMPKLRRRLLEACHRAQWLTNER